MTNLRDELLRFVNQLRGAGVRVSIAETLDAMNGIVAAGLERVPMREALAATLIKDEEDRHIFDELFATFFGGARVPTDDGWRKRGSESSVAPGSGRIESESIRAVQKDKKPAQSATAAKKDEPREESETESEREAEDQREAEPDRDEAEGAHHREEAAEEAGETSDAQHAASASGHDARRRKIERTP